MMRISVILAAVAILVSGCAQDGGPRSADVAIVGTWDYSGVQTSPDARTLEGTLTIESAGPEGFSGAASLTEYVTATNQSFSLSGAAQGIAVNATTLDFDLVLNGNGPRRHVATLSWDTITGSWAETTESGTPPQGTFTAIRSAP